MTTARVLAAALVAFVVADAGPAVAADAVVRVIAERAEIRTGPSFTYRVVYVATRGEALPAMARASRDYWFQVVLPDGTHGWIVGDQVIPLAVDPAAVGPPSLSARIAAALFSPPPLVSSQVLLSFSAGLLGGEGLILFRPSALVAPHLGLEAFVGETVGEQADVLYYGGGANLFVWPASPVTPFFSLAVGGARGRKKADQFTIPDGHYFTANVGGGLLIALKKRITLRVDVREHVIFGPNYTRSLEEYSGGLAILF
jgi:hypothetical protein